MTPISIFLARQLGRQLQLFGRAPEDRRLLYQRATADRGEGQVAFSVEGQRAVSCQA